MQISPTIIFGLALFVFALPFLPDKCRPTWIHRLTSWQVLIGLVAVIVASVIVATPEFYALGILGDSAFFDLLVLAISFQLRGIGLWVWRYFVLGFIPIQRFVSWRIYATSAALLFIFAEIVSTAQKVVHRISS
jgi:energy-coupling factor transporter transmembrane protein EcfT